MLETFRVETCAKLFTALQSSKVLLFRSPPSAGKTSLAKLFKHYLEDNSECKISEVKSVSFLGWNPTSEMPTSVRARLDKEEVKEKRNEILLGIFVPGVYLLLTFFARLGKWPSADMAARTA